jgi:hypothetical protein
LAGGSERKTESGNEAGADNSGFGPVRRESNRSDPEFGSPGGDFGRVKRDSKRSVRGFGLKSSKRGGGGKLSRTETVTVRLDPKLRYLAELAARKQRRTLSSFVEWAIEEILKTIQLPEGENLASMAEALWDVDEPDRFVKLALLYPDMLTHDEQVLWKLITENGYVWRGCRDKEGQWIWSVRGEYLIIERLREYWEAFQMVAHEGGERALLPTWVKEEESPFWAG